MDDTRQSAREREGETAERKKTVALFASQMKSIRYGQRWYGMVWNGRNTVHSMTWRYQSVIVELIKLRKELAMKMYQDQCAYH